MAPDTKYSIQLLVLITDCHQTVSISQQQYYLEPFDSCITVVIHVWSTVKQAWINKLINGVLKEYGENMCRDEILKGHGCNSTLLECPVICLATGRAQTAEMCQ